MSEKKRKGERRGRTTHRHHRRRKSWWRIFKHSIKKRLYRNKWLGPALLAALAIVAALVIWTVATADDGSELKVQANNQVNMASGYRELRYQGKRYRYNNRVTAILYAGVDSTGDLKATRQFTIAPRADSIQLLVLDESKEKLSILALNRDTMTKIHRFTLNGKDRGEFKDHLGYAFTYGDGGERSCRNLCDAVSQLLFGIPVNEYVVSNVSAITTLGDLVGPVTLTAPNDDLKDLGIGKGQTVTVDTSNLEKFVRTRDTGVDLSNTGRMERQRAYLSGAMNQTLRAIEDNPRGVWNRVEKAENCVMMNITRSRYLDLVNTLGKVRYSDANYIIPEGRQVVGEEHDEFYPDQQALFDTVLELFYLED